MTHLRKLALAAVTASALLVSACDAGQQDATDGATSTSPSDTTDEAASTVPEEVVVHRPGMIDNNLTAEDVPHWPGPDPADFLAPGPSSGERGALTGDDATAVYRAAQENPETLLQEGQAPRDADGAFWWVDDHAEWLVVEPVE
ncbi:hypothetical protein [Corynebacterium sp.]|jgi:hypothetical protein|uniref:hypothetical protein n=1 Tax=Corynebacterium sp. TaxID=1720 RepID=UPI0025C674B0|nr:hypothetical protein [Corynebacterium sp.]